MAKASPQPLVAAQAIWLLACGAAAALPLALHVPPWLALATLLTLAWRAWLAWSRRPLPSRPLRVTLTLAGCAGVILQYHTLFGQSAGIALLMLFMALKQLEARSGRDGLAIVFLAYFLALAQFIYAQTIAVALVTMVTTVVATAALANLADPRTPPPRQLRLALSMLGQSLPLMLVMFVLFPRVQGPLWGLPADAHTGLTGLSDHMAPGSICRRRASCTGAARY
jgi:hypothetical protein